MIYSIYKNRLNIALEKRGFNPSDFYNLFSLLQEKANKKEQVDKIYIGMVNLLEIHQCEVSHCNLFTLTGYSNCKEAREPGSCKKAREYRKNQKIRAKKFADEILEEIKKYVKCESMEVLLKGININRMRDFINDKSKLKIPQTLIELVIEDIKNRKSNEK